MNSTRVRTPEPSTQEMETAGEFHPTPAVRITMEHGRTDRAVLYRHRVGPAVKPDRIAVLKHAGGVVSEIEWDVDQRQSLGVWAVLAERWARARVAADWGAS